MGVLSGRGDVIVIGGGIAGASAAYFLSKFASVILLESEEAFGFHATGRSAAVFAPDYGSVAVRQLTSASRPFFFEPPDGFASAPIVRPRGLLYIARDDQLMQLRGIIDKYVEKNSLKEIDFVQAKKFCPLLRPHMHAAYDSDLYDIDVDLLLQSFLRGVRERRGETILGAPVSSLTYGHGVWAATSGSNRFEAPILVNAAGAWADTVGAMAGLPPLGLMPCRRTAMLFRPPTPLVLDNWPMALDVDEQFYLKPDAGAILGSPCDETPELPADSHPEEYDVAVAADRLMSAFDVEIVRISHRWSGQRTFAPDRDPVIGSDPRLRGFFWSAGQGGYGIQTAPAWGETIARCIECGSESSLGIERLISSSKQAADFKSR